MIEPSDFERAELPECSANYITALEDQVEELTAALENEKAKSQTALNRAIVLEDDLREVRSDYDCLRRANKDRVEHDGVYVLARWNKCGHER